ncbi:MAG: outer membrane protein assembly factor BamE [Acidobacteriota bacterium]|nr:outer membrane protein assembly factor BamE [Acidobacteriota bacterium]
MRRLLVLISLAAVSCGGGSRDAVDNSSEWLHVLRHKQAAQTPNAPTQARQVYADSLGAFVRNHPTHSRAREVYEHIQLDFARELASLGRYQDSIHFYRAVLAHDPQNVAALRGLGDAVDHLAVSREKLLALQKGMSQRDVARLLGKPIPGWQVRNERPDSTIESWYYRRTDGGIAGVYFRDGALFAAEENSQAKVAPLMKQ